MLSPISVAAYSWEMCARGKVLRSASTSADGTASPPRVTCSSLGAGSPSVRSSASRNRQNVGVPLA